MKFGLLYNLYSTTSAVLLVGLPHAHGFANQQAKRKGGKGPCAQERLIKSINFRGLEGDVPDSDYLIQLGDEFIADLRSIDLSDDGSTVALGSSNDSIVQIFQYDSNSDAWVQLGSDISETNTGWDVKLSADGSILAAAGMTFANGGTNQGRVQVFEYSSNTWNQIGSDITGDQDGEFCGISMDLNAAGDIVAMGCGAYHDADSDEGRVRVYEYTGGAWNQLGSDIIGAQPEYECGYASSLNAAGDIVAVGCGGGDDSVYQGRVSVFQYDGGAWSIIGGEINGDADYEYFASAGVSLSAPGEILAAASPGDQNKRVRVFESSSGSWTQVGSDIVEGTDGVEDIGASAALAQDGTTLIASGGSGEAAVYTYTDGTWVMRSQKLTMKSSSVRVSVATNAEGTIFATITDDGAKVYSFPVPPTLSPTINASAAPSSSVLTPSIPGPSTTSIPTVLDSSSCCCDEKSCLAKLLFSIF